MAHRRVDTPWLNINPCPVPYGLPLSGVRLGEGKLRIINLGTAGNLKVMCYGPLMCGYALAHYHFPAPLSCGCPWLGEDYGSQPRRKNPQGCSGVRRLPKVRVPRQSAVAVLLSQSPWSLSLPLEPTAGGQDSGLRNARPPSTEIFIVQFLHTMPSSTHLVIT